MGWFTGCVIGLLACALAGGVFFGVPPMMAPKDHPLPVVIPHDRITGTHGEPIGNDAVLYCTRDLKTCMPVGFNNAVHAWTPTCDAQGNCRASVEFASFSSKKGAFVFLMFVLELWMLFTILILIHKDGIHEFFANRIETNFNRKLRRFVLLSATGHDGAPRLPDAARNKETLMTYFPDEGFRLYFLWKDAPVFPAWTFQKVAPPPSAPYRVAKEWKDVARLYHVKGTRFDIGLGVGVEWRVDGGMRVWHGDTAYDAHPAPSAERASE